MDQSLLPYAPLTHAELNRRVQEALLDAGHRVGSIFRQDGIISRADVDYLRAAAARSDDYQSAAERRMPR